MTLRYTDRLTDDLANIYTFIALNNSKNAQEWVEKLRIRAQSAANSALIGRVMPELRQPDIREVFVDHYLIVYRVEAEEISVLTDLSFDLLNDIALDSWITSVVLFTQLNKTFIRQKMTINIENIFKAIVEQEGA